MIAMKNITAADPASHKNQNIKLIFLLDFDVYED